MSAVRIAGALLSVLLVVWSVRRHQAWKVSRLNLILTCAIALVLLVLSLDPSLFDPVFATLNARPGTGQRLTVVLIGASVVLFLLVLRLQSAVDTNERAIRLLVESIARDGFDRSGVAALPGGKRIVVVSPAYDEAENVGAVIRAMPAEVDGYRVVTIVVDDHSEDGTAAAARDAGALAVRLPIRRGGGLALRVGYDLALELGADIVVSIDADGQHQPEELATVVRPIIEGRADHVNGSRMLGDFERDSLIRHLGVHFFSRLVTILTGQRVTDISSGYRATSAATLRTLLLEQDQFWTSEVTIEALRRKARVVEVPVTFLTRRGGVTKKPKSLRYGWNFTKAIVKTWLR
ncbi:MAG: glycosyltransferase family 2 protein [Actinomycetota bacterium]